MPRTELPPSAQSLIQASRKIARDNDAEAVVILSALPYNFNEIRDILKDVRLVVATDKSDVMRAATEDSVDLVPLLHEPAHVVRRLSLARKERIDGRHDEKREEYRYEHAEEDDDADRPPLLGPRAGRKQER